MSQPITACIKCGTYKYPSYRKNQTGLCIKCVKGNLKQSEESNIKRVKTRLDKYGKYGPGNYKPGKSASPETQFKKGLIPWNKGKPHLRGDNHPMWKGGLTPLIRILRNHPRYQRWRQDVFIKNDYKCLNCETNKHLEAHHEISFQEILRRYNIKTLDAGLACETLWDVNNGSTLCAECHELLESPKKKERWASWRASKC
jgi:hypothetical protein